MMSRIGPDGSFLPRPLEDGETRIDDEELAEATQEFNKAVDQLYEQELKRIADAESQSDFSDYSATSHSLNSSAAVSPQSLSIADGSFRLRSLTNWNKNFLNIFFQET